VTVTLELQFTVPPPLALPPTEAPVLIT
jgi:hypothetical protein